MVGLDQAVANLVQGATKHLGEDTVVIVTSDNGENLITLMNVMISYFGFFNIINLCKQSFPC